MKAKAHFQAKGQSLAARRVPYSEVRRQAMPLPLKLRNAMMFAYHWNWRAPA